MEEVASPARAFAPQHTASACAERGDCLKAGGRLAYSTCSLNPIEDEAVVWAVLRATKGALRLVDCRKEKLLPGLVRRDGIETWSASEEVLWEEMPRGDQRQSKAGVVPEEGVKSFVDDAKAAASKSSKRRRKKQKGDGFVARPPIADTMKPPAPGEKGASVLKRCMRIMPHDQDTGGFFVAIFEKVSPYEFQAKHHVVDEEASLKVLRGMGFNATVGKNTDFTYEEVDEGTFSACSLVKEDGAPTALLRQHPDESISVASSSVKDAIGGWAKEIGVVAGTEAIVVRRQTSSADRWSNLRVLPEAAAWVWPHVRPGGRWSCLARCVEFYCSRALNEILENAEDDGHGNMIPASFAHIHLPDLTYGDFSVSMDTVMAIAGWCEDAGPGAPLLIRPKISSLSAGSAPDGDGAAGDQPPPKRRRLSKAERKRMKKKRGNAKTVNTSSPEQTCVEMTARA